MACEGLTDAAVLARLVQWLGLAVGPIHVKAGKGQLDRKLRSYNEAAKLSPWLVVRDLDSDAGCAPTLVRDLLPAPAESMCFRLAVPQVEAWLLADRIGMSSFLGVRADWLPVAPDETGNAKYELVRLARRSRYRPIREDMVPEARSDRAVGRGYTARIVEFARERWRPGLAENVSPSLASCIRALRKLST